MTALDAVIRLAVRASVFLLSFSSALFLSFFFLFQSISRVENAGLFSCLFRQYWTTRASSPPAFPIFI